MPRGLTNSMRFPTIPPVVTFVGPIAGSGITLLKKDLLPTMQDDQLRCCGFINLATYLMPGNPLKTPYGGYHAFQVFVIFPIHAQPWDSLCKKLVNRPDSAFQSTSSLVCTGKVAGLLHHNLMVNPPLLTQDYIFIVVPDSWTFQQTPVSSTVTTQGTKVPVLSPTTQRPTVRNAISQFSTPRKRKAPQTPPISSSHSIILDSDTESPSKRHRSATDINTTPSKKPTVIQTPSGPIDVSADTSFNSAADVSDDIDELQMSTAPKKVEASGSSFTSTDPPVIPPPRQGRHTIKKS